MNLKAIKKLIRINTGLKPVFKGNVSPNMIIFNDLGHSWWSGAEHHIESFYGVDCKGYSYPLHIKKEHAWTNGHETLHEEGETLEEFIHRTGLNYPYYVLLGERKEYGEGEPIEHYAYIFRA